MNKKVVIIFGCAILLSFATAAYSGQSPYVSGNLGFGMQSDTDVNASELDAEGYSLKLELETGLALGIAVGYDLGNNIRVEGEFAYQKNEIDKAVRSGNGADVDVTGIFDIDVSSSALLANGYYDIRTGGAFTPFVGAGLGFAQVQFENSEDESDDDTVLAYQISAGLGYALNQTISLDAKYRYFATTDPEFDGVEIEYSSHNFYVGVRYAF